MKIQHVTYKYRKIRDLTERDIAKLIGAAIKFCDLSDIRFPSYKGWRSDWTLFRQLERAAADNFTVGCDDEPLIRPWDEKTARKLCTKWYVMRGKALDTYQSKQLRFKYNGFGIMESQGIYAHFPEEMRHLPRGALNQIERDGMVITPATQAKLDSGWYARRTDPEYQAAKRALFMYQRAVTAARLQSKRKAKADRLISISDDSLADKINKFYKIT